MHCGDQRHLGLCLGYVPALAYGSCRVSDQGTTLRASNLHNARTTILNPFINALWAHRFSLDTREQISLHYVLHYVNRGAIAQRVYIDRHITLCIQGCPPKNLSSLRQNKNVSRERLNEVPSSSIGVLFKITQRQHAYVHVSGSSVIALLTCWSMGDLNEFWDNFNYLGTFGAKIIDLWPWYFLWNCNAMNGTAPYVNTLRPRQDCRHLPDDIFKCIFVNENVWISIMISLKFVSKGEINNIAALVQIMAWRRPGDKPLSGPGNDGQITDAYMRHSASMS